MSLQQLDVPKTIQIYIISVRFTTMQTHYIFSMTMAMLCHQAPTASTTQTPDVHPGHSGAAPQGRHICTIVDRHAGVRWTVKEVPSMLDIL